MTVPIHRLDVPLTDVEAHMAEQKRIACLLTARLRSNSESDRLAYAMDVALIETHAAVPSDLDYPEWAAALAASPTFFRSKGAL